MSLHFNGAEIKEVYFNGTKLTQVNFNGEKVWPSAFMVTGSNWSGSSSGVYINVKSSVVTGNIETTAVESIECFTEIGDVSVLQLSMASSFGATKSYMVSVQAEGVAAYGKTFEVSVGYWTGHGFVPDNGLATYLYQNRTRRITFSFAPM